MARIITGTSKNIELKVPEEGTRPITDRAKAAVFSILGDYTLNSIVLDLYAGSGSLGLEALSRGAKSATLVDSSAYSINCIKQNLKKTHLEKNATVIKSTVESFIKNCDEKYELVFMDPPYDSLDLNILGKTAECIESSGILVLKHSPKTKIPKTLNLLTVVDSRKYGENQITFLRRD